MERAFSKYVQCLCQVCVNWILSILSQISLRIRLIWKYENVRLQQQSQHIHYCEIISMSTRLLLGCNKIHNNYPLNRGYHCTEGNYIMRGNLTQGFCTWTCLTSQQCAAMSYNPVTVSCLLMYVCGIKRIGQCCL